MKRTSESENVESDGLIKKSQSISLRQDQSTNDEVLPRCLLKEMSREHQESVKPIQHTFS